MPGITAYALLLVIAAWAMVSGVIELVAAYELRDVIRREWLLALDGVLAIVFGLLLFVFPGTGALALIWLIGAFAIASGAILVALAFRMRGRADRPGTPAPHPSPLS